MTTSFPTFFDSAPIITLRDPLTEFLGSAAEGRIEYRFADVVKLTGHACPTVAAAFLMTRAALNRLYCEDLPVRGNLRVEFRETAQEGTTGVVANVVAFITGAATDTGFKGISGHFGRCYLLAFDAPIKASLRITRTDTGVAVDVSAHPEYVSPDPQVRHLLARCLSGSASTQETIEFRTLWQDRVRKLLLEYADDPAVFHTRMVETSFD